MKEKWKVFGEGNYAVSNKGRVRRETPGSKTWVGKIMKIGHNKKGYPGVQLYVNGKNTCYFVHKLVAQEFIGPRPKGKQVNHKDLNKKNNDYRNLEYKSGLGNIRHAIKNGVKWGSAARDTHGENNPFVKLSWEIVRKMRKLDVTNKYTQQEIADKFNLSQAVVWPILAHRTWKEIQ